MAADHLVLCLGLSRAGSTLQYNLAANLIERLELGHRLGFSSNVAELGQLLQSIKGSGGIAVLKTYNSDLAWMNGWLGEVSILTIYRDLRDVYSSCKKKRTTDIDEFINRTKAYLDAVRQLRTTPRVLYQRYEGLYNDLGAGVREISDFLRLQTDEAEILRVWEMNTLDSAANEIKQAFTISQRCVFRVNKFLRQMPLRGKTASRVLGVTPLVRLLVPEDDLISANHRLHPDHISKSRGRPGSWKHELRHNEARKITEAFRPWLKEHGYP